MTGAEKNIADRFAERRAERDKLAAKLAAKHMPGRNKRTTDLIFNMAWENGHASGTAEVEGQYIELAGMGEKILAANT